MIARTQQDAAAVVRRFWAAQVAGDRAAARACVADDLTWQVVGRTHPVARSYHGPDGFFGELLGQLGRAFEPGSVRLEVRSVLAAGADVVTEFHETATAVNGHRFEIDIVTVMRVVDDRIRHCREYLDLAEVTAAFGTPADQPTNREDHR